MKYSTAMNRIEQLIDSTDYKKAYVEIETKDRKLILEMNKKEAIGFNTKKVGEVIGK